MKMLVYQGLFSVFPTCVGVIPLSTEPTDTLVRIPHMCGGDPISK